MCYVHSSLFHSSARHFPAANARDRNRGPAAPVLIQRLELRAAASPEPPAEAKPALAPASRARTARQGAVSSRDPGTPPSGGSPRRQPRQGAVSSPRRCPNQPLPGPPWHKWRKWLKVAAWTLAFLLSAGGDLITPSRS